jgi:hypothetical protein
MAYNFKEEVYYHDNQLQTSTIMATEVDSAPAGSELARSEHNNHEPQFGRFMELPVEIREKIYEEDMLTRDNLFGRYYIRGAYQPMDFKDMKDHLSAVWFTSKSEKRVAACVFIRNTTFFLSFDSDFARIERFVHSHLGEDGLKAVRHFHVYPSSSTRLGSWIQSLRRFPALRKVRCP